MSDERPPIELPTELQDREQFLQLIVEICRAGWEYTEGTAYEAAIRHGFGMADNPFRSETRLVSLALAWDMGIARAAKDAESGRTEKT
jgi:hypothetical protein